MFQLVMIRMTALLLGAFAIVFAMMGAAKPFREITALQSAHVCAGGVPTPDADANGCITVGYAVVAGRSTSSEGDGTTYKLQFAPGATLTWALVDEHFYDTVAVGQRIEVRSWRGDLVKLVSDRASRGYNPLGTMSLVLHGIVAWAGLGLVFWFLAGDGTLEGLFGAGAMRAGMWVIGGAIVAFFGVDLFAGGNDFGWLIDGVLGMNGLALAVTAVVEGGPFMPENPSLLELVWGWRYRRRTRQLQEQGES